MGGISYVLIDMYVRRKRGIQLLWDGYRYVCSSAFRFVCIINQAETFHFSSLLGRREGGSVRVDWGELRRGI